MTTPIKQTKPAAGLALAAAALSLSLGGCAALHQAPPPGATLAAVTAQLGQPSAVYREPDGGQDLEYRGQPMGQFQYMARIGADGGLVSYEQVLTDQNFARVRPGQWNKDEVLRQFGRPAEVSRVRLGNYKVWSYRYKHDGIWNSFMNIYFDGRGEVVRLENTPDPMLEERFRGV